MKVKNSSQIKVCHFITTHQWNDDRIFIKECRSTNSAGFKVFIVAYNDKEVSFIEDGIEVKLVKNRFKSRLNRIIFGGKTIYNIALSTKADIFHFHDPELLPYALKLKKKGNKVIYDVHEDVPRQILNKLWIPRIFRRAISFIFERYENCVAKRLDYIITATPYIANRFIKICDKVTAIKNYPLLEEFGNSAPWSKKNTECCYIGGLTRKRGMLQILEAVKLSQARLHLCGDFESEEFQKECRELLGYQSVEYHGYVGRAGIKNVLDDSKIGLVTLLQTQNHIHSYPVKMFEYMAAGIPVIASNFPLWKSIVEDSQCGVCVNPLDEKAIADAILSLTHDDEKAMKMGQNGRNAVISKYNWGTQRDLLIELYKSLIRDY